jgi:putative ABC transport system substrate-binding protein
VESEFETIWKNFWVACGALAATRRDLRAFRPISSASGSACSRVCFPGIRRVALLYNKRDNHELEFKDAEASGHSLEIGLVRFPFESQADFEPTFKRMIEQRCDAVYVTSTPFSVLHREKLAQIALDYGLPTLYGFREFAEAGGLMSYGANLLDACRRGATFVDKILKGSRPSDLPIEQPTRFELVINARTAKALGLEVPPTLLALADEVNQAIVPTTICSCARARVMGS